jgi:hypothetical protein
VEIEGRLDAEKHDCTITYSRGGEKLAVALVRRDLEGPARGARVRKSVPGRRPRIVPGDTRGVKLSSVATSVPVGLHVHVGECSSSPPISPRWSYAARSLRILPPNRDQRVRAVPPSTKGRLPCMSLVVRSYRAPRCGTSTTVRWADTHAAPARRVAGREAVLGCFVDFVIDRDGRLMGRDFSSSLHRVLFLEGRTARAGFRGLWR